MGDIIKMQFVVIRERIIQKLEGLPVEIADNQPEGFNNTIHWNLGHLLWVTEKLLFQEDRQLPAKYDEYFGPGTKPADWQGNVPNMEELLESLKEQLIRIKEIPNDRFLEELPEPLIGRRTRGELAGFLVYHEAYHFGQMVAMQRVIHPS
jgi:uncharacterized damage-inducible protein DinB